MIRKRFIVVVAAIAAVAAGAVGTVHSAGAAGPVAKYVFVPTPIAAAGALASAGTVSLTVEAEDASNVAVAGANIYLSLTTIGVLPSGASTGSATATDATHTTPTALGSATTAAVLFVANGSGQVPITYTGPCTGTCTPAAPTAGRDVITAQDGPAGTVVVPSKTDSYTFSPVTGYNWVPAPPIAATGSLAANGLVNFVVQPTDSGGPVANADLYLSVSSTFAGVAHATDANGTVRALTTTPGHFAASPTGNVPVAYSAPATLPNGGTDTITVQNIGGSTPGFTSNDTYTFAATGPSGFSGQASLGDGPLGGDPQSVATGPGSADVFWKGTDGNLWYTHSVSGGWAPAASLGGGPLGSNPHPVFSGGSTVDVFWKGADGNLWHVYTNGGAWASPSSLGGGTLGSDPQVTSSGNHDVAVFWRGGDKNLWEAAYQPGPGWRAPIFLGSGPLNGVPHAAAYNTNSYDVFWRGGNNAVWHNFTSGSTWSGAQSLGMGPIAGDPIAISAATNTVDIYWQGGDGGLWHGWYNAAWHGAQGYGGSVSSPPSPIAPTTGTVDAFWRSGTNIGHLLSGVATTLTDTTVTGNPSAFSWGSGHEEVFWTGTDGNLWHDSKG
jgi:hypothetical protein